MFAQVKSFRTFKPMLGIVIASVFTWAAPAMAASLSVKGQVEFVRTHDASVVPGWAPPTFWFTLKGVTSAGNCQTWNGRVLFVGRDKQALSVVLAAQVGGQEIAVYVDDTVLTNNSCTAGYLTIGNPAPLW